MTFTSFDPTANAGAAGLVQLPDGTFVAGGSAGTSFGLARYWSDNGPPAYAEGSANAVFVNNLYEQLLNRPADQPGLTGWLNALTQGANRAQIAQAIEASREYLTRLVDSLYTTLLGRPADSGGEAGFVNALANGMSIECTPDHPVFTPRGGINVEDLYLADDFVGVVRELPCGIEAVASHRPALLSYALSERSRGYPGHSAGSDLRPDRKGA